MKYKYKIELETKIFLESYLVKDNKDINKKLNKADKLALNYLLSTSHDDFVKICNEIENIKWYFSNISSSSEDTYFSGIEFFFNCVNEVNNENKDRFIEITWCMFDTGKKFDDFHPWAGQFDPLYEEDANSKSHALFREGVIKYEYEGNGMQGHIFNFTYKYGWWKNFEHFISEIAKFSTEENLRQVLEGIGLKLRIEEFYNLSTKRKKVHLLNTYKSLENEKKIFIDKSLKNTDWDDIKK